MAYSHRESVDACGGFRGGHGTDGRHHWNRVDRLISRLNQGSKWDFVDLEILELALAVRFVSLEAAGKTESAAAAALDLSKHLDPDLLPGILLQEVLDRTKG